MQHVSSLGYSFMFIKRAPTPEDSAPHAPTLRHRTASNAILQQTPKTNHPNSTNPNTPTSKLTIQNSKNEFLPVESSYFLPIYIT